MRILVCGDRNWTDRKAIFETLDMYDFLSESERAHIIEGAARGADTMAGEWAVERGAPLEEFPAEWTKHGRSAGPIRNAQMLREGKPDIVIAFHDDLEKSKGTKDMVRRAKDARLPVRLYYHVVRMKIL
jgi:YspA, cpYpsA-related SLOG family